MKYVLDASAGLKWVLPEVDSAQAIRVRDQYQNGILDLLAPDIFPSEIGNGLVSAELQGRIKAGDALVLMRDVLRAAPVIHSAAPLMARSMVIAISTRRAVYDCLYLALAEAEGCELLTADDQFARALRPTFPFIVSLFTLP